MTPPRLRSGGPRCAGTNPQIRDAPVFIYASKFSMPSKWTAADCAASPCPTDVFAAVGDDCLPPWPGARGLCLRCGGEKIAKCGPRIRNHWAHRPARDWDPWSEAETAWHLAWKSNFPSDWHEKIHIDQITGEQHRSDVGTPNGVYIEVQNSLISDFERSSRENFYKNLIWIVNGAPFLQNFNICHRLPDPESELAKDLAWYPAQPNMTGTIDGMCWRISENPQHGSPGALVKLMHWQEIDQIVEQSYRGHHQFTWVRPRTGWLDAKCPVFFDFGGRCLWKLERYDKRGLRSVRAVEKKHVIEQVKHAIAASEIGSITPAPANRS